MNLDRPETGQPPREILQMQQLSEVHTFRSRFRTSLAQSTSRAELPELKDFEKRLDQFLPPEIPPETTSYLEYLSTTELRERAVLLMGIMARWQGYAKKPEEYHKTIAAVEKIQFPVSFPVSRHASKKGGDSGEKEETKLTEHQIEHILEELEKNHLRRRSIVGDLQHLLVALHTGRDLQSICENLSDEQLAELRGVDVTSAFENTISTLPLIPRDIEMHRRYFHILMDEIELSIDQKNKSRS